MNIADVNKINFQLTRLPSSITSELHKRVSSKITRIFKKTVLRIFTFNLEDGKFSYVKGNKSSMTYSENQILNFSPNVEKELKLSNFKYDFRIYLKEKKYELYTNEKNIYDEWMRVLNYFFFKVDILIGRVEQKIPDLNIKADEIKGKEEKKEHILKKEVIKEKKSPILIPVEETNKESKSKDVFKFEIENLILTKEIEEQSEFIEENEIQSKHDDEILKENANNTNEDYNRLQKNMTRKILKQKIKKHIEYQPPNYQNQTEFIQGHHMVLSENNQVAEKNDLDKEKLNVIFNENVSLSANGPELCATPSEFPVESNLKDEKPTKDLNFNTNKWVDDFEKWA